jgi:hypothetical protein
VIVETALFGLALAAHHNKDVPNTTEPMDKNKTPSELATKIRKILETNRIAVVNIFEATDMNRIADELTYEERKRVRFKVARL